MDMSIIRQVNNRCHLTNNVSSLKGLGDCLKGLITFGVQSPVENRLDGMTILDHVEPDQLCARVPFRVNPSYEM